MIATLILSYVSTASSSLVEYSGEIQIRGENSEVVLSPLPSDVIRTEDLPAEWDWRLKGGLLTTDLNQHIPV